MSPTTMASLLDRVIKPPSLLALVPPSTNTPEPSAQRECMLAFAQIALVADLLADRLASYGHKKTDKLSLALRDLAEDAADIAEEIEREGKSQIPFQAAKRDKEFSSLMPLFLNGLTAYEDLNAA